MGNVFNRYGAGGGKSEGIYIWKKYGQGENSVTLTATYNDSWAEDYQFTRTIYEATSYEFKNGKYELKNPRTITITGTAGNNAYNTQAGYFYVVDENPNVEMFESVAGATYRPVWIIATGPYQLSFQGSSSVWSSSYKPKRYTVGWSFIGYVVSDDSSAYPDKQEQGGYWYEKMSLSPSAWGCTKFKKGSFTLASSVYYTNVSNTLGVVPKFAFLWSNNTDGTKWQAITYTENGNGTFGALWGSSNDGIYYYGGSATTTTVRFETRSNSTAYYYKAGTFNYILLG